MVSHQVHHFRLPRLIEYHFHLAHTPRVLRLEAGHLRADGHRLRDILCERLQIEFPLMSREWLPLARLESERAKRGLASRVEAHWRLHTKLAEALDGVPLRDHVCRSILPQALQCLNLILFPRQATRLTPYTREYEAIAKTQLQPVGHNLGWRAHS